MNLTLEMVDDVMIETGCSYGIAKQALIESDGDKVLAIEKIKNNQFAHMNEENENEQNDTHTNEQEEETQENTENNKSNKSFSYDKDIVIEKLKYFVNEGIVNEIIFERDGKTILNIPVLAGAVSAIVFIFPTVVAIGAALIAGCEIKLEMKDGKVYNFNEITMDKIDELRNNYDLKKQKKEQASNQSYTYSKVYDDEDGQSPVEEADYESMDEE